MKKKDVLTVKNLSKIYSKNNSEPVNALNNLNLDVKQGEIFGLLGPNGAGKSTFINILGGTVIKSKGNVNVWGYDLDKDPRQVRASLGIVPQEVNLDPFFNQRRLLELHAGMYGIKKKDRITNDILKLVSLENNADSYARSLSGGMKRRLLIAKALVHNPEIIILDEPTAGVDIDIRTSVWNYIKRISKEGKTICLTTHYLEEAEQMCARIGILNKGNLVALDSTINLLKKIQTKKITFKLDKSTIIKNNDLDSLKILSNKENEISLSYEKNKIQVEEIINLVQKNNVKILDISTDDGDLEDVFLGLTEK